MNVEKISDIKVNIKISQIETVIMPIQFKQGDKVLDITGWTIFFTVKKQSDILKDDTYAVIKKTLVADGELATIVLSASDTNINPEVYRYDLKYKKASGDIFPAFRGSFVVMPSITKRTS